MEKAAFNLKPGEISHLIGTPDGYVVVKCVKRLPPQVDKKLEDVRAQLVADCSARKLNQVEIPALARELREQAHPKIFIKKETPAELMREVRREIVRHQPEARAARFEPSPSLLAQGRNRIGGLIGRRFCFFMRRLV